MRRRCAVRRGRGHGSAIREAGDGGSRPATGRVTAGAWWWTPVFGYAGVSALSISRLQRRFVRAVVPASGGIRPKDWTAASCERACLPRFDATEAGAGGSCALVVSRPAPLGAGTQVQLRRRAAAEMPDRLRARNATEARSNSGCVWYTSNQSTAPRNTSRTGVRPGGAYSWHSVINVACTVAA